MTVLPVLALIALALWTCLFGAGLAACTAGLACLLAAYFHWYARALMRRIERLEKGEGAAHWQGRMIEHHAAEIGRLKRACRLAPWNLSEIPARPVPRKETP